MLRYVFLATITLLATTTYLSAQTAPAAPTSGASSPVTEPSNDPEQMEDPQTGDHWTYEIRDEITGGVKSTMTYTVTDVSPSDISIRVEVLGTPQIGFQTFDRSWNMTNGGIWRYKPNDGTGVRTPLTVGKTWSFKGTDSSSTAGASWKRTTTSRVLSQESVTTGAGTFDTFKIETSIQIQHANDPTKKLTAVQQSWHAPAINHWVKRTFVSRLNGRVREKSTSELVEYGRR